MTTVSFQQPAKLRARHHCADGGTVPPSSRIGECNYRLDCLFICQRLPATIFDEEITWTSPSHPIIGPVHIGYLPRDRVVGISKLVRLVDVYAKRMQVQEKMTAEIAHCLNVVLKPLGVGVVIEAVHECMTTRGVHRPDVSMVTSRM